jgi:hypothetical protein
MTANTITQATRVETPYHSACLGAIATSSCGCGGAGCAICQTQLYVRPQFFAGQLLTEDDLQSLEEYVLAKNRLHNRRLFGEGVVCGFQVLCHPCGEGRVLVQPGYSLDCCGNDIELSCKVELDINAMIRDLRQTRLGGYDCGDPCAQTPPSQHTTQPATAKPGDDFTREYCLYVRYCEAETDLVSPYSPDQPCTPVACEPSRIREGLRFELRCPETQKKPPDDLLAALWCCFRDVIGKEKMSQDALTVEGIERAIREWEGAIKGKSAADLQERLLALIDCSPHLVGCGLRDRILSVRLTPEGQGTNEQSASQKKAEKEASEELVRIFVEIMRDCVCSAVLPPCRDCTDTGVLLACLKVKHCEVIEICNLSRHFVPSPVALRYWVGADRIEHWLHRECCTDPDCRDDRQTASDATEARQIRLPILGIAEPARLVQAIARAAEILQPRGSQDKERLAHIATAFGVLAGEPISRPEGELLAEAMKRIEALQHEVEALKAHLPRQGETGGQDG